jgi:hypothetical protein
MKPIGTHLVSQAHSATHTHTHTHTHDTHMPRTHTHTHTLSTVSTHAETFTAIDHMQTPQLMLQSKDKDGGDAVGLTRAYVSNSDLALAVPA